MSDALRHGTQSVPVCIPTETVGTRVVGVASFKWVAKNQVRGKGKEWLYNTPLVDGIIPAIRGSRVTAIRTARPMALKTVSAT